MNIIWRYAKNYADDHADDDVKRIGKGYGDDDDVVYKAVSQPLNNNPMG